MATAARTDIGWGMLDSPVGELLLFWTRRGLARVGFPTEQRESVFAEVSERLSRRLGAETVPADLRRQLAGYFSGSLRSFSIPLDRSLIAGEFTREVLRETETIPYGRTTSYADIAAAAGSPRGSRAAGNALGSNPLPIVIPCHRVVRACGALGGYGGGLDVKRTLLALEGAI